MQELNSEEGTAGLKTRHNLQLLSNASDLVEAGRQTGLVLIVRERQVFNRALRAEANRHTRIQLSS